MFFNLRQADPRNAQAFCTVTGINFSGSRLGAAFALPLVVWLIEDFGWRITFLIMGVVGVLWALAWYVLFRDNPENHRALSQEEKDYILAERQERKVTTTTKEKVNFGTIIKSKNVWLAMGQYFCSNFTFFFALTWLFPHIKTEYN